MGIERHCSVGWLVRWSRGRCAKGEIGPCPGHDPWPTLPSLSASDRLVIEREHKEDEQGKADRWGPLAATVAKRKGRASEQRSANVRGPVAATASEGGEARGVSGVRGCAGGPRSWAIAHGLGRAAGWEAFFSFSFFCFSFLFHCLNSNLV